MEFVDHRRDPAAWAKALGISREAVELYLKSDVIDLHIDSFIWTRIFGYDLRRRHGSGILGRHFYSQVDLPRVREAGMTGGVWIITTNPLRGARGRAVAFRRNLERLVNILDGCSDDVKVVRTVSEYRAARAAGKHGAFIGVQGGNALDAGPDAVDALGDTVVRVTLVHLSNSKLGHTSAPGGGDEGLTATGRAYVAALDARKVLVDLAHINRRGFFDALEVHDKSLPAVVTHTGVTGVHQHWRNIDDEQIKAIAATGGTVGVMFQCSFLGGNTAARIVDHLDHICQVAGEDFASLGSDFDGMISPPPDLPTCLELPRLVEEMLRRKWSPTRVQKVLGGNWLRTLAMVKP